MPKTTISACRRPRYKVTFSGAVQTKICRRTNKNKALVKKKGRRQPNGNFLLDSEMSSIQKRQPKKEFNQQLKKRPTQKPARRQNDLYITTKSNFKAQQKECEDLLNSGIKEIYLHCLGNAINRGINLALHLINNSNNALSYAINTSTIQIIDELHPLCDEDDIAIQQRNNSAIHIRISRNTVFNIDIGNDY